MKKIISINQLKDKKIIGTYHESEILVLFTDTEFCFIQGGSNFISECDYHDYITDVEEYSIDIYNVIDELVENLSSDYCDYEEEYSTLSLFFNNKEECDEYIKHIKQRNEDNLKNYNQRVINDLRISIQRDTEKLNTLLKQQEENS